MNEFQGKRKEYQSKRRVKIVGTASIILLLAIISLNCAAAITQTENSQVTPNTQITNPATINAAPSQVILHNTVTLNIEGDNEELKTYSLIISTPTGSYTYFGELERTITFTPQDTGVHTIILNNPENKAISTTTFEVIVSTNQNNQKPDGDNIKENINEKTDENNETEETEGTRDPPLAQPLTINKQSYSLGEIVKILPPKTTTSLKINHKNLTFTYLREIIDEAQFQPPEEGNYEIQAQTPQGAYTVSFTVIATTTSIIQTTTTEQIVPLTTNQISTGTTNSGTTSTTFDNHISGSTIEPTETSTTTQITTSTISSMNNQITLTDSATTSTETGTDVTTPTTIKTITNDALSDKLSNKETKKITLKDHSGKTIENTIMIDKDEESPEPQKNAIQKFLASFYQKTPQRAQLIVDNNSDMPIEKISFEQLDTSKELTLGIDRVESLNDDRLPGGIRKAYAINPEALDFTTANVTATAQGNELYKCKTWDYTEQKCTGSWEKIMDLTPGQEYTFTITPTDPGYAETGVASINTNKPMYHTNEQAEITIIVLNKEGYLTSQANVTLTITTPSQEKIILSPLNGGLTSEQKGIFKAQYTPLEEGTYNLSVEATGPKVNNAMFTSFSVKNIYPFDIIRTAPHVIDPWNGEFSTTIHIIPYIDTQTITVREEIPSTLLIVDSGKGAVFTEEGKTFITWSDIETNGGEIELTYTIEPPLTSPELYTFGPVKIYYNNGTGEQTFEEARQWYIAADPPSGRAIVAVGIDTAISQYWLWDAESIQGAFPTINTGADVEWIEMDSNPNSEEIILASIDTTPSIDGQVWNGTGWKGNLTLNTTVEVGYKGFDVAYEQVRGWGIVAYRTGSNIPKYRIWNGTAWNREASALDTGSAVRWVELASEPGSNYIAMVTGDGDANEDINLQIWNGSQWFNNTELVTAAYRAVRNFDVEWTNNGYAVVVHGDSGEASARYSIYNKTKQGMVLTNQQAYTLGGGGGGDLAENWIELGASRRSDIIIAAVADDGNDVELNTFNTTTFTWGSRTQATNANPNTATEAFDIAFSSSSGTGIIAYGVSGDNMIYYRTWAGSFSSEADITDVGDVPYWIELKENPLSDEMLLLDIDNANDVDLHRWNTTGWEDLGELANNLVNMDRKGIGIAYEKEGTLIPRRTAWNISNLTGDIADYSNQTRGMLLKAYANWTLPINQSYAQHNGLVSNMYLNFSVDPPFRRRWTNYTINTTDTNVIDHLGMINISIFAKSQGGEWGLTTPVLHFYLYGLASVTAMSISDNLIQLGSNITIQCKIEETAMSQTIQNYPVRFFRNGTYIGTNITAADGWATITYQGLVIGDFNVTCNITNNVTSWYFASEYYQKNVSLRVRNISDVSEPVINWVNSTPNPASYLGNVTITANITDNIMVNVVLVQIQGTNYTMTNISQTIWSYTYSLGALAAGFYNYTVYANDTSSNNAESRNGNYTISNQLVVNVTTDYALYSGSQRVNITTNVTISGLAQNASAYTDIIRGNATSSWWNSSWKLRRPILINNTGGAKTNVSIRLNVTGLLGNITNCTSEIRVADLFRREIPVNIIAGDNSTYCDIVFMGNVGANAVNEHLYDVYFNFTNAPNPGYSTFWNQQVFFDPYPTLGNYSNPTSAWDISGNEAHADYCSPSPLDLNTGVANLSTFTRAVVSFNYREGTNSNDLAGDDCFYYRYYANGGFLVSNQLVFCNDIGSSWQLKVVNITTNSSFGDFYFRFYCELFDAAAADLYVDNLNITGYRQGEAGINAGLSSTEIILATSSIQGIGNDGLWNFDTWNVSGQPEGWYTAVSLANRSGFSTGYNYTRFQIGLQNPVINYVYDSPDPVPYQYIITITANVTSGYYTINNVSVQIQGVNYSMSSIGNNLYRYSYNTSNLSAGFYNYTIHANDTSGLRATPLTSNFTITNLLRVNVSTDNTQYSGTQAVRIATNVSIETYPHNASVYISIVRGNGTTPWWNSSWKLRKPILINNTGTAKINASIRFNVTGLLGNITNCVNEIRVADAFRNEIPVNIVAGDDSTYCDIVFMGDVSANALNEHKYDVYFNNTAAANPGYSTFWNQQVFFDPFPTLGNYTDTSGDWDIVANEAHADACAPSNLDLNSGVADLSSFTLAVVSFNYREGTDVNEVDADDCFYYRYYANGGFLLTDQLVFCNDIGTSWRTKVVNITTNSTFGDFSFRFRCVLFDGAGEDLYVDNLNITGYRGNTPGITAFTGAMEAILNTTTNSSIGHNGNWVYTNWTVAGQTQGWYSAISLANRNNYSSGYNYTFFQVLNQNPVINSVTDTPDPVPYQRTINITANVTSGYYTINNVSVQIQGVNYSMNSIGNNLYRYTYNTSSLSAGFYNYTIHANDSTGLYATPLISNFTINNQLYVNVTTDQVNYSVGENVNITTNVTNLDIPTNSTVITDIILGQAKSGWWNTTWKYRKPIYLNNTGASKTNVSIRVNVTGLAGNITSCTNEIRVASIMNEEVPVNVLNGDDSTYCEIVFLGSIPAGVTNYYYYNVYYNNSLATNPNYAYFYSQQVFFDPYPTLGNYSNPTSAWDISGNEAHADYCSPSPLDLNAGVANLSIFTRAVVSFNYREGTNLNDLAGDDCFYYRYYANGGFLVSNQLVFCNDIGSSWQLKVVNITTNSSFGDFSFRFYCELFDAAAADLYVDNLNITGYREDLQVRSSIGTSEKWVYRRTNNSNGATGIWSWLWSTTGAAFGNYTAASWANKSGYNPNLNYTWFRVSGNQAPTVTLNTLSNGNITSSSNVTLNCSAIDDMGMVNATLYGNWSIGWHANRTNPFTGVDNSTVFNLNLSDGTYIWNCHVNDTGNLSAWATANFTFTIDTRPPNVTLISPPNHNLSTDNVVNFIFNITDRTNITRCDFILDGAVYDTAYNLTTNINQTFTEYIVNGAHNWTVNCTDSAGNTYGPTPPRNITISGAAIIWGNYWYETSTFSCTSSDCNITLANYQDSTENAVTTPSIGIGANFTMVTATSSFFGSNGIYLPANSIVNFSAELITNPANKGALKWSLYYIRDNAQYLMCNTSFYTATSNIIGNCSLGTSAIRLESTDRFRLVLTLYNNYTTNITVIHYWDQGRASYFRFNNLTTLGILSVDLVSPITNLSINQGQTFSQICNANCSGGTCLSTQVYADYNSTITAWAVVSTTGNLTLNQSETNPHSIGSINVSTNTTFAIMGNESSTNYIRCRATSSYSNSTGTTIRMITVNDTSAPIIVLDEPDPGDWVNTSNVTFFFTVNENTNLSNCSLILDGTRNTTKNSSQLTNHASNNFTVQEINNGQHNWSVNCTDTQGNTGTVSSQLFYIDNIRPTISLSTPTNGQPVAGVSINFIYNVTDLSFVPIILCNLTVNGTYNQTNIPSNNSQFTTVNMINFPLGAYYWNVTCWDNASNANTSETRMFNVTDVAPTVNLTTPVNGEWTNNPNITFEYYVEELGSILNCSLIIDGIQNQTNYTAQITNPGYNFFDVPNMGQGMHNWTVLCYDYTNFSTQPTPYNFTIDTTAPAIQMITPSLNAILNSSTVGFQFIANDTLSPNATCTIYLDNEALSTHTDFSVNTNQLITRTQYNISDGYHIWNVSCTDVAENTQINSSNFTMNSRPQVTLNYPNPNQWMNDADVNFSFYAYENDGFSNCSIYINGTIMGTLNSEELIQGLNNIILPINDGINYTWYVTCIDNGTYQNTNTTPNRTFSVDTQQPSITLNYPISGETVSTWDVVFNFTADDNLANRIACNVSIDSEEINYTNLITTAGQSYNFTVSGLTDGPHTWQVTCWDNATNSNTSNPENFILNTPPYIELYSPINMSYLNNGNVSFLFYTEDNDIISECKLILNGLNNATINESQIANGGNNTINVTGLTSGFYNWTINCTSQGGNNGTANPQYFYVDVNPPSISLITPPNNTLQSTNNISFSWNVTDNMAVGTNQIQCNLSINGYIYDQHINTTFNTTSGQIINQSFLLYDGAYYWNITCWDNLNNTNRSSTWNFTIESPPNVTLNYPVSYYRTKNTTIVFNYTPTDFIGFENCTLIYDGIRNGTNFTITKNEPNYFIRDSLVHGTHNWTVECIDQAPDSNNYTPTVEYFRIDTLGPNIVLNTPYPSQTLTDDDAFFNFTATDQFNLSTNLTCNLTLDNVINISLIRVISGGTNTTTIQNLSQGNHNWSVTCWDDLNNTNTSNLVSFIVNAPDLFTNTTGIFFNNTNPIPGNEINISATIWNIGGATATNAKIQFWNGNPSSGGTQINGNRTVTIGANSQSNVSVNWAVTAGMHTVWVLINPGGATELVELNYSNNNATKTISTLIVNITSPLNATKFNTTTVNISFIMQDFTGGTINYTLYANSQINRTGEGADNSTINQSITFFEGTYNLIMQVRDALNRRINSSEITIFIDATPPSINFTNPTPINDYVQIQTSFVINVSHRDANPGTVILYFNGLPNQSMNYANGTTNFTVSGLEDGIYPYYVWLNDTFGLTNQTEQRIIRIDLRAPTINLESPAQGETVTSNAVPLRFNVSDSSQYVNCTLYINGSYRQSKTGLQTWTSNYFVENLADGTYNWSVNCTDQTGLSNVSETRNFTVAFIAPIWEKKWYETFNRNFSTNASINLSLQPDLYENWANMTVSQYSVATIINATSPFLAGNGAYIPSGTILNFSGVFQPSTYLGYITWKVYIANESGSYLIGKNGNDNTNATNMNVSGEKLTYTNSTTTNQSWRLGPLDSLKLIINIYNNINSDSIFMHFWDESAGSADSWFEFGEFYVIGSATVELIRPSTSIITAPGQTYNQTCYVNCTYGTCINTKVYAQYNVTLPTPTDWANINGSGTLILATGQTNPIILGNLTGGVNATFVINGSIASANSIRCYVTTDYTSAVSSTIRNVTVNDSIVPVVVLTSPANNTHTKAQNISLYFNVTENIALSNCSLILNNIINQTKNSANLQNNNQNNFTLENPIEGLYSWSVNCTDTSGNVGNSSTRRFAVDRTPPAINLTFPPNTYNTTNRLETLNFTITDNIDTSLTCNITFDGTVINNTFEATNNTPLTTNTTPMNEGLHYWNITCWDNATNTNTSETRIINMFTPPAIILISPANNTWTNNRDVVFTFNVSDNTGLSNCSLVINGIINQTLATEEITWNGTNSFLESDMNGTFIWAIECYDNTTYKTYNISENRTLYVDPDYPEPAILTYNNSWFRTHYPTISFIINDTMDPVLNYTFYVNGITNTTGIVNSYLPNTTTLINLSDGIYDLIVQGRDEATNTKNSSAIRIFVDTTPPNINLSFPYNSNMTYNATVTFNFTVTDNLAANLTCNLTISGGYSSNNFTAINGTLTSVTINSVGSGSHYWNVTCWDYLNNTNTSETWNFTIPSPDLTLNSSEIIFSNNTPRQNDTITINATIYNIGNTNAYNVTIQFYYGDPDLTGTQINGNITRNITTGSSVVVSVNFSAKIGHNNIFVVVDPPTATNGLITEANESNNKANNSFEVSSWHYVIGNTSNELQLSDLTLQDVFNWIILNSTGSNIYVADTDSIISWSTLMPIGQNISNQTAANDFSEIDQSLGSTDYYDGINITYTANSLPREVKNFTIFGKTIYNVPVMNSTVNDHFKTGILWDYRDTNPGEFNRSQDIIFITEMNQSQQGIYGLVDFEIRIPANLSNYLPTTNTVTFYTEIT